MATTFSNLVYHIVFSTKNRLPLIGRAERDPLYQYIGGIVRTERGALLEIGGMPDHVHLLVRFKPDFPVPAAVRTIKANSSRWWNARHGHNGRFEWQTGYGVFSVSESQVPRVQRYIQTQEEHHARVSFRDELVELLNRHGIAFDERYLLG